MLFLKIGIEDQDTFLLSSRGVDRHEPSEVPVLIKHNEPKKTMNSILNRCHSFNLIFGLLLLSNVAFGQAPVFTNAKVAGGTFSVQVLIASNQLYTIQVSTNLTSWNSVGSDTATNSLITLVDPRGTAGFSHQYYRIMFGAVASFSLQFLEFANAGSFNSNSTPNTTFPVSLNSYSAALQVNDDANYPSATNVFFTGPAGSGLTNAAGDPNNSSMNDNSAFYQSPIVTSPTTAPAGNDESRPPARPKLTRPVAPASTRRSAAAVAPRAEPPPTETGQPRRRAILASAENPTTKAGVASFVCLSALRKASASPPAGGSNPCSWERTIPCRGGLLMARAGGILS